MLNISLLVLSVIIAENSASEDAGGISCESSNSILTDITIMNKAIYSLILVKHSMILIVCPIM